MKEYLVRAQKFIHIITTPGAYTAPGVSCPIMFNILRRTDLKDAGCVS